MSKYILSPERDKSGYNLGYYVSFYNFKENKYKTVLKETLKKALVFYKKKQREIKRYLSEKTK